MTNLLPIFLVVAFLALLEALYSAKSGLDFLKLFRESVPASPPDFAPPVTLIVPCKGVDVGLKDNLDAYFQLDYPNFQVLFVIDAPSDPCVSVLQEIRVKHPRVWSHIICAGKARKQGQKVHNLLCALRHVRAVDEVFAFGDSDIRPSPSWLRYLVGGLKDAGVGLSTGYRWYLPQQGNTASVLRSVWNAGIASLMKRGDCYFAWGGAVAVRRQVFEECRVVEYWQGALSDDYAISRAVHDHGKTIRFQPHCLSFSHEDCGFREILDWSTRQLRITRIYHPSLWTKAFVSQLFNNLTLWGGSVLLVGEVRKSGLALSASLSLLVALVVVYALGCFKGWVRIQAVAALFPQYSSNLARYSAAYIFAGPLAALVSLQALLRSLLSREIKWRGIRYRMVSPKETQVLT